VGPALPNKAKVITQPTRDTLVLQFGVEFGADNPTPQKVYSVEKLLKLEKKLRSTKDCNVRRRRRRIRRRRRRRKRRRRNFSLNKCRKHTSFIENLGLHSIRQCGFQG
jgi:hypothetical protein